VSSICTQDPHRTWWAHPRFSLVESMLLIFLVSLSCFCFVCLRSVSCAQYIVTTEKLERWATWTPPKKNEDEPTRYDEDLGYKLMTIVHMVPWISWANKEFSDMKLSVEKVCLLIYYRKNENDYMNIQNKRMCEAQQGNTEFKLVYKNNTKNKIIFIFSVINEQANFFDRQLHIRKFLVSSTNSNTVHVRNSSV
jgi:hypothetical protein